MKLDIQYVSDGNGNTQSVQLPITEWKKVLSKLKHYEETLKIKSDLQEAFAEVKELRKSKSKKQSLKDFLNEL